MGDTSQKTTPTPETTPTTDAKGTGTPAPIPEAKGEEKIDIEKIQEMVEKGLETKSNAILNSYSKQLGIGIDEIKELYRQKREKTQEEQVKNSNIYKTLEKELSDLKATIKKDKQNAVINKTAKEFGYDDRQLELLRKLIDTEKLTEENIEKELKEQFRNISEKIPANTKNNKLGFNGKTTDSGLNNGSTFSEINRKRWNRFK